MNFINIIYNGISNLAYLIRSDHSHRVKLKIVFSWLKINLKFLFGAKRLGLKTEKILAYQVEGASYVNIRTLFEEIFFRNEYHVRLDKPNPVIFDCGANIGFATLFLKFLYPDSTIYSFEPDRETFKILKRNIERNKLNNVHLYNSAVSNYDGEIDFYIDPKSPGSLVMSTIQERMSVAKISTEAVSLVSFIKKNNIESIDFIKMDIEGAECTVLNDLLNNGQLDKIGKMVIEYHHKINTHKSKLSEFLKIFEANNFEYQIDARCIPINAEDKFQDVLLYCYK